MGDRANVAVVQNGGKTAVFLYTHWRGTELALTVQTALRKNWRWDDDAYLTRIIFEEMVPKDSHGTETGFGISMGICDNQHPIIVVNPWQKTVGFADEKTPLRPHTKWSFDEFVKMDPQTLEKEYRE